MELTAVLEEAVRRIATRFAPEKIILFGSHARGAGGPDSDLDLLVVMDVSGSKRAAAVEIDRALFGLGMPKDVIVVTPEEVERYRNVVGTIIYPAVREGKILYESKAARGHPHGSAVGGTCRGRPSECRAYTLELRDDCPVGTVCFHAQQCTEKYLKALLTLQAIPFSKTHDVFEILAMVPHDSELRLRPADFGALNRYAVETRYPGDWEPITRQGAEEAVVVARNVREAVRICLPREVWAEQPPAENR